MVEISEQTPRRSNELPGRQVHKVSIPQFLSMLELAGIERETVIRALKKRADRLDIVRHPLDEMDSNEEVKRIFLKRVLGALISAINPSTNILEKSFKLRRIRREQAMAVIGALGLRPEDVENRLKDTRLNYEGLCDQLLAEQERQTNIYLYHLEHSGGHEGLHKRLSEEALNKAAKKALSYTALKYKINTINHMLETTCTILNKPGYIGF